MRVGITLISALSVGIIQAVTRDASVYTFGDSVSPPNDVALIAPETARLVLAQRLGVSQYHRLSGADDSTLDLLAQLGGRHNALFKDDRREDEIRRILVVVEGIENPESKTHQYRREDIRMFTILLDIFGKEIKPTFKISNPPPSSSNRQLVLDFLTQDRHRRGSSRQCPLGTLQSRVMAGGYSANDVCIRQKVDEYTIDSIYSRWEAALCRKLGPEPQITKAFLKI